MIALEVVCWFVIVVALFVMVHVMDAIEASWSSAPLPVARLVRR